MEAGKILLGTLAGVAIGAVVGVLMEPDKGSETRKKISKKGSEYTEDLKEKYEGLKAKYTDMVDGMTNKLESLGQKGEDLANQGKAAMHNTAKEVGANL